MIATDSIMKCELGSYNMRENILNLAHQAGSNGAHIGPALSMTEIMAVLYLEIMQYNPHDTSSEDRDRFILSKGHGALGYYVAMYEAGVITKEELFSYEVNGSAFPGQPSKNIKMGIEYSGGSLGLGLSYASGIALAAKLKQKDFHTYVLMGDGELNEGSVWESAMFAKHNKLSNLTAIIDRNGMQSDGACQNILSVNMQALWQGFGWDVVTCDGHNVKELLDAFKQNESDSPKVIIANTVKGKGISFMENAKEWHHNRLTDDLYRKALTEIQETRCE